MNGKPDDIAKKQVEVNHNHGMDNERNRQSISQASVLLVLGIYPMMSEEEKDSRLVISTKLEHIKV